ncbi:hypothetical protein D3C75_801720 [compost metagenome]
MVEQQAAFPLPGRGQQTAQIFRTDFHQEPCLCPTGNQAVHRPGQRHSVLRRSQHIAGGEHAAQHREPDRTQPAEQAVRLKVIGVVDAFLIGLMHHLASAVHIQHPQQFRVSLQQGLQLGTELEGQSGLGDNLFLGHLEIMLEAGVRQQRV